jgi:hypothetical protein
MARLARADLVDPAGSGWVSPAVPLHPRSPSLCPSLRAMSPVASNRLQG